MFAYCQNSPTNLKDSTGACPTRLTTDHRIKNKIYCPCGGAPLEGFSHGNYSNFNSGDLFSETKSIDFNIGKSEANYYYDRIKRGDYGRMFLFNPLPYLFGFAEKGEDLLSLIYDLFTGVGNLGYTDVYDPKGRLLYIEEGYHIIMWNRVFLLDTAAAAETEYFIYDDAWNLVFNDVIIDTYITD